MATKLKRPLHGPDHPAGPSRGSDVLAVKRGLSKVEERFFPRPPNGGFDDVYNRKTVNAVKVFQRLNGIVPTSGNFGQATLDELWPYMDAYARYLYWRFKVPVQTSPQELAFQKLTSAMQELSEHTPGYQLGGGHGVHLSQVSSYQKLDCSSSTSKALYEAGLFSPHYAWVSGQFESWGEPGPGHYFTIYANSEHVWTRLHKSRWWRFDTSPHGDGGRGPKLRYLPRFTASFVARHYPEM